MDTHPLDLVLAVVTASVTIFVGFLPVKTLGSRFFAREAIKATAAWVVVAALSPLGVIHFAFILAVLCFIAWWNFQRDDAFTGKIWLSLAAGLGISISVMVIIVVTPESLPGKLIDPAGSQGWDWGQALCLASLYLGGAVIGLACVGYVLCREAARQAGMAIFIQNGLGLLFNLTVVRAVVLLVEIVAVPGPFASNTPAVRGAFPMPPPILNAVGVPAWVGPVVGVCVFVVLPVLAHFARRGARFSSRLQPTRLLAAIILVGFVTEILARLELR
jgi:hypothetical protein